MAYLIQLSKFSWGFGAFLGLVVFTMPAWAQSAPASPTESEAIPSEPSSENLASDSEESRDVGTANLVDPNEGFNSPDGGGDLFSNPSGPMELIHRAVLMNNMSLGEFRQQQSERLSQEAANFLQLQQEAIRREEAASATDETSTPVTEGMPTE